jgi:hypothetical protein
MPDTIGSQMYFKWIKGRKGGREEETTKWKKPVPEHEWKTEFEEIP